ncbi:hypothetical protein ASPFODRAFT_485061 [Aspergillus luchuensis CBS 106.47]|uniref:Uncharacterized protein n=1 Tax=Aspergillus luchuensis (strain CBS 106.47) TaxID=1137211 RepID=A0A1M3TQR8_ASPLC|nr:hypothetical protein ASPFODRAFT_485061 [Aspergillus luchuensis CBS 106.47]
MSAVGDDNKLLLPRRSQLRLPPCMLSPGLPHLLLGYFCICWIDLSELIAQPSTKISSFNIARILAALRSPLCNPGGSPPLGSPPPLPECRPSGCSCHVPRTDRILRSDGTVIVSRGELWELWWCS